MYKRIVTLSAVAAMTGSLLTGLSSAPATAADPGTPPTLTTPTNGGTMLVDQSRTVALDTSAQVVGETWGLSVDCNTGSDMSRNYTVDGSGTWSDNFAAATPGQQCTVYATAPAGPTHNLGTFTVDETPPALELHSLTRTSASIYPWVRDGYYDYVDFEWETSRPATHAITIRNSNGTLVRSATVGGSEGYNWWTWGGYSNAGKPAAPGIYTVKVVATDEDNQKADASTQITVRRTTVTTGKTLIKNGDNGARAATGSCYATRDSWEQTTDLDCWGGRYARVTYSFTIPSNATNVSWNTSGSRPPADFCCITRTGSRPRSNLYQVRVQVTGWRAYTVNRAWIHYSVRTPR
jgi:hypothetical protein